MCFKTFHFSPFIWTNVIQVKKTSHFLLSSTPHLPGREFVTIAFRPSFAWLIIRRTSSSARCFTCRQSPATSPECLPRQTSRWLYLIGSWKHLIDFSSKVKFAESKEYIKSSHKRLFRSSSERYSSPKYCFKKCQRNLEYISAERVFYIR